MTSDDTNQEQTPILNCNNNHHHHHHPQPKRETSSSITYHHTLIVLIPYLVSKCALAASNAFLQYLFGQIQQQQEEPHNNYDHHHNNNNSNNVTSTTKNSKVLASEATILQWEFLIMGLCMGGMRAVSVMSGKCCAQIHLHFLDADSEFGSEKKAEENGTDDNNNSNCCYDESSVLFRGLLRHRTFRCDEGIKLNPEAAERSTSSLSRHLFSGAGEEAERWTRGNGRQRKCDNVSPESLVEFRMFVKLRAVFVSSFVLTTIYGIIATLLFVFTSDIFKALDIVTFTSSSSSSLPTSKDHHTILQNIQDYCSGFAFGVLPTLWLYGTEQFLLGCHAPGAVFAYGMLYAFLCAVLSFVFALHGGGAESWHFSYSSDFVNDSPLFGLGLGMSVAAWISFLLLQLHLLYFDRMIFRDLCTVCAVVQSFREKFCVASIGNSDGRASFETLKSTARNYFGLSSAMGLSNVVGLICTMIIAAQTLKAADDDNGGGRGDGDKNDEAKYYSIASAYFQTLSIAVLAASSAVSALVAVADSVAKHSRDKFAQVDDAERARLTDAHNQVNSRCSDDTNNVSTLTERNENRQEISNNSGNDPPPRLKTAISRSLVIVCIFALALSVPPLIIPDQFIDFFGGDISNFNSTTISNLKGEDTRTTNEKTKVYDFLIPAFLSFVTMTLAMCVSASLHALFDVTGPLFFHIVTYAAGVGWSLGFGSDKVVLASYGSVIGPTLYLIVLVVWLSCRYLLK